ncbi:MAG: 3'-5' DNA helicase [Watsoniomyces obsoletus]|nr:MAG: 3'-5' DNA helicase [Watsoniomyces obsoletus]
MRLIRVLSALLLAPSITSATPIIIEAHQACCEYISHARELVRAFLEWDTPPKRPSRKWDKEDYEEDLWRASVTYYSCLKWTVEAEPAMDATFTDAQLKRLESHCTSLAMRAVGLCPRGRIPTGTPNCPIYQTSEFQEGITARQLLVQIEGGLRVAKRGYARSVEGRRSGHYGPWNDDVEEGGEAGMDTDQHHHQHHHVPQQPQPQGGVHEAETNRNGNEETEVTGGGDSRRESRKTTLPETGMGIKQILSNWRNIPPWLQSSGDALRISPPRIIEAMNGIGNKLRTQIEGGVKLMPMPRLKLPSGIPVLKIVP